MTQLHKKQQQWKSVENRKFLKYKKAERHGFGLFYKELALGNAGMVPEEF